MDTSNSAFRFYYLPPMIYQMGKVEMVSKYHMFDEKMYDELYQWFGRYVRFYKYFWSQKKIPLTN